MDLKTEFKGRRQTGISFVIDVSDGIPRLALYRMKMNYSSSTTLSVQPPENLLREAVREKEMAGDGLYTISPNMRIWIEKELLD